VNCYLISEDHWCQSVQILVRHCRLPNDKPTNFAKRSNACNTVGTQSQQWTISDVAWSRGAMSRHAGTTPAAGSENERSYSGLPYSCG
jgi:hypothetical protein